MRLSNTFRLTACCIFLGFLLTLFRLPAQQTSLYYEVFDPTTIGAHPLIWGIAQDSRGLLYMANNEGVLVYDGANWQLVRTPKEVRSVAVDANDRVFVGCAGDLGWLYLNAANQLHYVSLKDRLPAKSQSFTEIVRIYTQSSLTYYFTQSACFVYALDKGSFQPLLLDSPITGSGLANGKVYVTLKNQGLFTLNGSKAELVLNGNALGTNEMIAVAEGAGKPLLLTKEGKLFSLRGSGPEYLPNTPVEKYCKQFLSYDLTALAGGTFAVSTQSGGVLLANAQGNILQTLNRKSGLPDDNIYSVFVDRNNGLWVGHGKGLARYLPEAPVRLYTEANGLNGKVNNIRTYKGSVYVATVQGVYALRGGAVIEVKGLRNECWQLETVEGRLLAAANDGVYEITADRAQRVLEEDICLALFGKAAGEVGWVASDAGVKPLSLKNNKWFLGKALALPQARIDLLAADRDNNLLISTNTAGLLRVESTSGKPTAFEKGLPSTALAAVDMGDRIVAAAGRSLYIADNFGTPASRLSIPGLDTSATLTLLGKYNDRLFIGTNRGLAILSIQGTNVTLEQSNWAFLSRRKPGTIWATDSMLYIGVQNQVLAVVNSRSANTQIPLSPIILGIFDPASDSLLAPGRFIEDLNTLTYKQPKEPIQLASKYTSLRFVFAMPSYDNSTSNEYQYRLDGADTSWSNWSRKADLTLSNLAYGDYTFSVRGRDVYGNISPSSAYAFSINRPIAQHPVAYALYGLFALVLFYITARTYSRRIELRAHNLELLVAERTREVQAQKAQIESQVEELNAQNESLDKALNDLKDTQDQLIQNEKMASLGQLVAGVAHEINTPVGVGVTAASNLDLKTKELVELVRLGQMKKSDFDRFINMANQSSAIILKNLNRAAELIQSFKKVAVDQTTDEIRTFGLWDYLHEIIVSLTPHIKRYKVDVSLDGSQEIQIKSSPSALSQTIINFVMNALSHAFEPEKEGKITIGFAKIGDRIQLTFADNGKGIPADVLPRIFDPFFTTGRSKGGSGLGLHIVYNLVTVKLKGTVRAESEVGKGTTFIVDFPANY